MNPEDAEFDIEHNKRAFLSGQIAAIFHERPIVSITTFMDNKDKDGAIPVSLVYEIANVVIGDQDFPLQIDARRVFYTLCGVHPDDIEGYDGPGLPKYFHCGECMFYHPAGFEGDCLDDANRHHGGELDETLGASGWDEVPEEFGTID